MTEAEICRLREENGELRLQLATREAELAEAIRKYEEVCVKRAEGIDREFDLDDRILRLNVDLADRDARIAVTRKALEKMNVLNYAGFCTFCGEFVLSKNVAIKPGKHSRDCLYWQALSGKES